MSSVAATPETSMGVMTVDHSTGDTVHSGMVTVISTVAVWLRASGYVKLMTELMSLRTGLGTVTVKVGPGTRGAVAVRTAPIVPEFPETVMVTSDSISVELKAQDDKSDANWPEGEPRDEELAGSAVDRAPAVMEKGAALGVVVSVTALGVDVGFVAEPIACSAAVVEQLEPSRTVVAGSKAVLVRVVVTAAVASFASVLEQVDSRASSLGDALAHIPVRIW